MNKGNDPTVYVRMALKPETRSIFRRLAGAQEKPLWQVIHEAAELLEKEMKV